MIQLAVLLALLPAATFEPAEVAAQGRQSAILTLERAGMVRLQARGGGGTACTLVDQLRGPFAAAGAVGREDCSLDLLLDAGRYQLRLESPARPAGTASRPAAGEGAAAAPPRPPAVALTATPFAEVNGAPVGLSPGRPVEQPLPEGKQASFWFRVAERGPVSVRVAGRTAGAVHLWRAGEWRQDLAPHRFQPEPAAGQPIHEWWVQAVLEPGDYRLTASGTAPLRFTRGVETDLVTVELGFAAPPERAARAVLPASGALVVATGQEALTALLTVETPGAGRARLSVHPLRADGSRLQEEEGNCVVEPKAQVADCAIRAGEGRHVLVVRGPAGAAVQLRWAPRRAAAALLDGEYREPGQRLPLEPLPAGDHLVGLHDVPADRDAAPLACALERQPEQGGPRELAAFDAPRVGGGRTLQAAFNYGRHETLWFEVVEAGEVSITTSGERGSACELSRVGGDGTERIAEGTPKRCGLTRRLAPGLHQLKLSGGTEGIEKVRIGAPGQAGVESPARGACSLRARLEPGWRYTLLASRTGRVAARGLVARRLPAAVERPLPIEVPAGETFRLPVGGAAGALRVAVLGGALAGCHLARGGAGQWRDGACWLDLAGPDELRLVAKEGAPLTAWLTRPAAAPPPSPAAPAPFQPAPSAIPVLAPGQAARFDFEPGQERALAFDVKEPGLYDVGTEGLLATGCAVRTPALPELASDRQGGRGRNCLVSSWLRPGRYLVSVRAEAPSRGRAGVVLAPRPGRELGRLDGEGERFFRAEAGELVRQPVAIPKAGRWALSATALGAELRCRLEDQGGWPLEAAPGPCRTVLDLPAGVVTWTQLPLTVESMRRTAAAPERPAPVLRGDGVVHDLALWRPAAAELGKDGQDEYRFVTSAEADVSILLTDGMMGRLYREGGTEPIELVPPHDGAAAAAEAAPAAEAGPAEPVQEEEAAPPEEGEPDGGEAGPAEEGAPAEAPARAAAPPPIRTLGPAPGFKVHLPAGAWRLLAEHSRGDVAIAYRVQVSVDPLLPGAERDLPVPSRVPLRVASAGTLRIRTTGEADVRCRLFDAAGRLVAASSEVGEDWNCGLAEPVAAGDYRLELESEQVVEGVTRLALAQPAPADAGPLADGRRYPLAAGVLSAALPPPAGDAVLEASLAAGAPIACAVDDEAGTLVSRSGPAGGCAFLLLPAGRTYRLRAWAIDRPTEVTARLRVRPVTTLSGGRLVEGGAARATVARAGTFRTADGVRCLAGAAGLLAPCGPEVSLEAGPVVLAAPGQPRVPLEEVVAGLGAGPGAASERLLALDGRPWLQRQRSAPAAAHLVAVTVAPGQRTVPACRLDGGLHARTAAGCFAAAGAGQESLLRLAATEPVEARLWRAAITSPQALALEAGRHRLEVAPGGTLASLPAGPVRAELTLPAGAWAVLRSGGAAADLCVPAATLARCVLTAARDADLLLVAGGERHVEAVVTRWPTPPPPRELGGLHETLAPLPGSEQWRLPAAGAERLLTVDGATGCAVALDDGARHAACEVVIPAGVAGTVAVEHLAGPLRLALGARDDQAGRLGVPPGAASPRRLAAGEAVALEGALVERSLELAAEAVVHVRADRGSCVLLTGARVVAAGGLGDGCRLDRLLPAGTHRLLVRGFGGAPLSGAAAWTAEPVEALSEGVGAERWLAPGEARLFRFALAARGQVGLGLREEAETLSCAVADEAGRPLGEGCQQLLALDAGTYLLTVRAPADGPASRFRPVLLGLAGAEVGVPDEYLRDLFTRIGGTK